jgi:mRNA-degrading endonuclease RelE of RelBE toxin-antitoxin system
MEFFETPAFTRHLPQYLDDEQYRTLQNALAGAPALGDVMPGTGGFRKLRWADIRRGKGRRGGLRVIYYWFDGQNQIWLMAVFDKNEAADLTPEQKRQLKAAIDLEKKSRTRR